MSGENSKLGTLDRKIVVPQLIGDPGDFLFIGGLAGTSKDLSSLTQDGDNAYLLAGVMGAAAMMGLGLALAQPDKRVLVATGDGELLMNVGALATIADVGVSNLAILCVDNGHYGETGYQRGHTSNRTDLRMMAEGAGIPNTRLVEHEDQIEEAAGLLRHSNGPVFVQVKVSIAAPPVFKRSFNAVSRKAAFRKALLGHE
jgi:thiamine pyrophosphate-dependent acetolactate synthase large subunit-like protein